MNYKHALIWVLVFFLFALIVMGTSKSTTLIALGVIVVPLVLIWQAYIILKAKDKPDKTWEDDGWYDKE